MENCEEQTQDCKNKKGHSAKSSRISNLAVNLLLRLLVVQELKLLLDVKWSNRVAPLLELVADFPTCRHFKKTVEVEDHEPEVHEPFVIVLPGFPRVDVWVKLLTRQADAHYETQSDHQVGYFVTKVEMHFHLKKSN